ncbi:SusD/RagB family nutrient-binding outer membrane lipoprotein [Dyadobacter sp. CY345]|uniref:SusD/RagB family nutrient-binding outer membrane lipoprotein n=1 Tax=Dyadobacter sp. CY345 TaxID=2909335 RepID=UPI001F1E2186|nr:SusD/RagB family nutrient-binding outer membrane lipoprotein [Dyadobacter sp. CY345]MCF2446329.1 SusD/RagB family nutrient-binding outer membrane lipoprotein [Dyadobacter sp. CY345]
MKYKILVLLSLMTFLGSCTKDFEEVNVNPNAPAAVPLDYLLSQSALLLAGSAGDPGYKSWRANFIYAGCIMQQMASVEVGFYRGTVYTFQGDLSAAYFESSYPNSIKNLVNLIDLASKDAKDVNILSMARILRVVETSFLTDLYGDVPYSEAGKGFISKINSPKYDPQQAIYMDMLKELDEASKAFNPASYKPTTADFVYGGDLDKWKKGANSLMLRIAMRMQKADATNAQAWAKKAIDAGIMSSNDDSFTIKMDKTGAGNNSNANSWNLGAGRKIADGNNIQWAKTFIDMMKARKDPRLPVVAALKNGDRSVDKQIGIPSGTDATALTSLPEKNLDNYSRAAPNMYVLSNPYFIMTYAESQFLKTEAIERGWATGDAKAAFDAGQIAAILQLNAYGGTLTDADAKAYSAANPYPSGTLDAKLETIQTENWLINGSVLNHMEAWADWRRTGFPKLIPVNYPGNETNGQIPRRLRYPQSEVGVNDNITEAISRQGGDTFMTKIWWDK